ncbi:unnamed protein product [Cylicocyclus nassatus]|uniref:Uncharacterized protein n=1 Tax=Cylicocyclus nassatus TaxID=53992 RepID=A0AA36DS33_CYLNA|nr:unnamed protein product [Cylicocyclus nassatus]
MFANGQNDAARQAAWEVELAARGEVREAIYNAMMNGSSPSWGNLVRSVSPVSPQSFGEHVEDFSPPASGRASVDHTTVFNAATRAELHLTESLERIEELEEELQVARRQIEALQWSRGLRDSQYGKSESLRKEQEKDLTRMVRDLQTVHEVLPRALEAHRAKVRSLHPEEEEELLHHFLRRGNVVETPYAVGQEEEVQPLPLGQIVARGPPPGAAAHGPIAVDQLWKDSAAPRPLRQIPAEEFGRNIGSEVRKCSLRLS